MLRITCLLTLVLQALCLEFDYYELPDLAEAIEVDCGSVNSKLMSITFGGEANSIYAAAAPTDSGCQLTEVGPARWYLEDALTSCSAAVVSQSDPQLRMLELVIQIKNVRTITDESHMITCNYELGGNQASDVANTNEGDKVMKIPSWHLTSNTTAQSTVELVVYDAFNAEVTTTELGNYIQLRALMNTTGTSEVSLKIWNCRAFTSDTSYYFVQTGCGDDHVIAIDRGFHTRTETDYADMGYDRLARSAYFKTFLFPGASSLTFECDYIVCLNTACDGYSCEARNARKKRDLTMEEEEYVSGGLPKVTSEPIHIIADESKNHLLDASDLIETVEDLDALKSLEATLDGVESPDVVTIGLIAGMTALGLVFLMTSCAFLVLWRRLNTSHTDCSCSTHSSRPLLVPATPTVDDSFATAYQYGKRPV